MFLVLTIVASSSALAFTGRLQARRPSRVEHSVASSVCLFMHVACQTHDVLDSACSTHADFEL